MPVTYRARWVFPVDGPPIERGCVTVGDDGVVVSVGRNLSAGTSIELPDTAITPGLVNAHTHTEFSLLESPLRPSQPFPDWLRALITYRRERGDSVQRDSTIAGLDELTAAGTSLVGEIATQGWAAPGLPGATGLVAFHESICLAEERIEATLEAARAFLTGSPTAGGNLVRGLSPHAPYTVHPHLLSGLIDLARQYQAPVAMHVAETPAEREILSTGSGELAEFLQSLGVFRGDAFRPARTMRDVLMELARAPRALVVHGNYLTAEDVEFLAQHPQMSVVYCPRTHGYFGHTPHSFRELQERGIRVVLGTDSRASSPDLSVWNEALHIAQAFPDFSRQKLLEMLTCDGARGLGQTASGTITPGKTARLARVNLTATEGDPYDALFAPGTQAVRLVHLQA